jgi:aminoglycoside phosphotransferase (APT) family kinase protein
MLSSTINAGKSAVHQLGADEIQHFIQEQPGVVGRVLIENVRGAGAVGASSGIVLFTATYDIGSGSVTRDLVLRHAPGSDTRLYFEYDLSRQFRVQRALQGSGVPVPEPLWLDPDGRWLGVSGYVMVLNPGIAPHPSAFMIGPLAEATESDRQRMLAEVMDTLVRIHRTDIKAVGLEDFVMNADGTTPMQRCINWYWQTWEWVRLPNYERLVPIHRWLLDNLPEGEPELMHGDSTLHNYLFHNNKLVGVLDWEMSSLGRAEADLALQCIGNALFAPPADSGKTMPPTDDEWLAMYQKAGGRPLQDFDYFKRFAAYMIVIAVSALQRNMPDDVRSQHEPLLYPLWALLES